MNTILAKLGSTAAGGTAATAAVHLAMRAGRRANLTDLHFPGALGSVLLEPDRERKMLGWALFVGNGIALAGGYRLLLERAGRTPIAFAALGLAHGLVAATGARLFGPLHPRPRAAGLPRREAPSMKDLAVLCGVHVIYGALLGAFFARGTGTRWSA